MGYGGLAGLPPDQIVSKQQSPQLLIDQVHFLASQRDGVVLHRAFDIPVVVVKFFWTRRSDGRVMHRRATGRQGWPAFRTVRVIGSQVLNAIGYCYKS